MWIQTGKFKTMMAGMMAALGFGKRRKEFHKGGKPFMIKRRRGYRYPSIDAPRPCLNCGKKHVHNNSFCSAGCCHQWRAVRAKCKQ